MSSAKRTDLIVVVIAAMAVLVAIVAWWPWGARGRNTPMTSVVAAEGRATANESRMVLEGVPRVGYNVRLCPFPGSLESVMKYIGEDVDYDTLMAVTGGAFRRFYNKDDGGNVSLEYLAPEVYRRAFWAMGYDYKLLKRVPRESRPELIAANRDEMLRAIKGSITSGRPVLAGVAGPECGIVAGVEDGGETLVGWSYFRGSGGSYYREPKWYESIGGAPYCVVVGEKHARPSEREVLAATLEWAVALERTSYQPTSPDHICGLAAYDAWADGLEKDADYPADDAATLQTRAMIQVDQVTMLADRGSGVKYLREAANIAPEAAETLKAAADLLEEAQRPSAQLWRWRSWQDPAAAKAMADPALRREYAAVIWQCKQKESAAVAQMEKALAIVKPVPQSASLKTPSKEELVKGAANWQVENVPLSIAVRAALNVMGDDLGRAVKDGWSIDHAYDVSMVYSGLAFESCVHLRASDRKLAAYAPSPASAAQNAYRRSLEAVGRSGEVLVRPRGVNGAGEFAKGEIQKRIVQAIGRSGRPVIIEYLPKTQKEGAESASEPGPVCVITGYERGGEVLVGWETNWGGPSILFEPEKRKQFGDWFENAMTVVVFGEKEDRNDTGALKRMLEQALAVMGRQQFNGELAGREAYEAWAVGLDDGLSPSDKGASAKSYAQWINPNIWDLAERRHYVRVVLDMLAPTLREEVAGELTQASREFVAIHDLMWEINRTGGSNSPGGELPLLYDPVVRKQIAELIRQAADHDEAAAGHLSRALKNLGG